MIFESNFSLPRPARARTFLAQLGGLLLFSVAILVAKSLHHGSEYRPYPNPVSRFHHPAGYQFKSDLTPEDLSHFIAYLNPLFKFMDERMFSLSPARSTIDLFLFNDIANYSALLPITLHSQDRSIFSKIWDRFNGSGSTEFFSSIYLRDLRRIYLHFPNAGIESLIQYLVLVALERNRFPSDRYPWFKDGAAEFLEIIVSRRRGDDADLAVGQVPQIRLARLLGIGSQSAELKAFRAKTLEGMFRDYGPGWHDFAWAFYFYLYSKGKAKGCYELLMRPGEHGPAELATALFQRPLHELEADFRGFIERIPSGSDYIILQSSLLYNSEKFAEFEKERKLEVQWFPEDYRIAYKMNSLTD